MRKKNCLAITLMVVMAGLVNLPFATAQVQDDAPQEVRKDVGRTAKVLFRTSQVFRFAGTGLDALTTGQGLNGPTTAYRKDGTLLGIYPRVESDPLYSWVGRRNVTGISMLLYAKDTGITYFTKRLFKDRHRRIATLVNIGFGLYSLDAVVHNMGVNAGMDARVHRATGYTGPIRWGQ